MPCLALAKPLLYINMYKFSSYLYLVLVNNEAGLGLESLSSVGTKSEVQALVGNSAVLIV